MIQPSRYRGQLSIKEINEAEIKVIKIIQASHFSRELNELINKRSITKGSLAALNPFIDDDKVIRVGGRLKGSTLTFTQKHPIILPSRHFLRQISLSRKYI